MAGLVPAGHVFFLTERKAWMPGTRLRRGFDGLFRCQAAVALAKVATSGMTSFAIKPIPLAALLIQTLRRTQCGR
jgi:hypothetical protein